MSEEKKPPFQYVAVTISETVHRVFLVHDASPEWWRSIASFRSRARADDYADVENMMAVDWPEPAERKDDESPVPPGLPAEPASGLTVLLTPTARPQIDAVNRCSESIHQTIDAPVPQIAVPVDDVLEAAAQAALAHIPKDEVVVAEPPESPLQDASGLPSLTDKQGKVWDAIRRGARTQGEIIRASGFLSTADSISALNEKGYITRAGAGSVAEVLAAGAARIEAPKSARSWTEAEFAGLKAMCEAGGDFVVFAKSISRTEAACRTQASLHGWYQAWSKAHWENRASPPATRPLTQEDLETVDIDDLNYAQKAVLKAIASIPHNSDDKAVAEWADLDVTRIPGIVARLFELGCLKTYGGFTTPTELGRVLVGQIKIARAVRILTPVVRRVPEKPAGQTGGQSKPVSARNGHTNGAEKPAPADGRIDACAYLERKGVTISKAPGKHGYYIVNGDYRSTPDVLMLINSHRRIAELPAIDESQIC